MTISARSILPEELLLAAAVEASVSAGNILGAVPVGGGAEGADNAEYPPPPVPALAAGAEVATYPPPPVPVLADDAEVATLSSFCFNHFCL